MAFPIKVGPRVRLRGRYGAALVIALAATVLSLYKVGLLPPSVHSRDWQIGAASTTLLIDTPQSEILNLHATTDDFGSLQARAALLGNFMASDPVKGQIAKLMGIPPSRIQATSPVTANVPQTFTEPGSGASATITSCSCRPTQRCRSCISTLRLRPGRQPWRWPMTRSRA
jgi:hypothetical protein